jgi:hypothetical protein
MRCGTVSVNERCMEHAAKNPARNGSDDATIQVLRCEHHRGDANILPISRQLGILMSRDEIGSIGNFALLFVTLAGIVGLLYRSAQRCVPGLFVPYSAGLCASLVPTLYSRQNRQRAEGIGNEPLPSALDSLMIEGRKVFVNSVLQTKVSSLKLGYSILSTPVGALQKCRISSD